VARERPTASDFIPTALICLDGGQPEADPPLTRAEAHALRRSAPLTYMQLTEHFKDLPIQPRPVD
jgi:hypothetical protein